MREAPPRERALLEALARDVERTTSLPVRTEVFFNDFGWQARMWVGEHGPWWSLIPALPEWTQQNLIEHLGHIWPRCPIHVHHPLRYHIEFEDNDPEAPFARAGWACPAIPFAGEDVGYLPEVAEPEEEEPLPPGTVRWYMAEWGWGLLADPDGDVWFHFSQLRERAGHVSFEAGEKLEYKIDPTGKTGAFRRARWVRKRTPSV